ncbi:MAG TPA: NAD(P)H-binding protein [Polyangiaceae bacterium]
MTANESESIEAWVAGATGLVGRALVGELARRLPLGNVTTLVRRPEERKEPGVEERVVVFDRLELELAGRTATHVFCCLGTTMARAGSREAFRRVDYDYPLALGRAARAAGAKKFLVVTALGADVKSPIFYNRVKGEIEQALGELGFPELHVFRPSLLLGERNDRRPGERLAMALAKPVGALLFGPLAKYRAIDADAVARAMVRVAFDTHPAPGITIYESDRIASLASAAAG